MSQGVGGCAVIMNQEHAKVEAGASCWAEVGDGERSQRGEGKDWRVLGRRKCVLLNPGRVDARTD